MNTHHAASAVPAHHTHAHQKNGEIYGPSRAGSVLVDIGGDIGALIIHTPAGLHGAELELSPADTPGLRTHMAVRERRGHGPTRHAAIFPSLACGTYDVWHPAGHPAAQVTITGGQVTQLTWPTA
ncbi:hypothetical protein [Streptacidiphilus sp. EB129]|uniref:hypothetical protein n=1 Tax=Streptacidiphilus sp. EB129 TaxID=3156262 RepID=UPI003515CA38